MLATTTNPAVLASEPALSTDEIVRYLRDHDVPIDEWARSGTWSLHDFLRYMTEGQFSFVKNGASKSGVTVSIQVAAVIVQHCIPPDIELELYEDCQVFDGKPPIKRDFRGLGEMMKKGESAFQGAKRCLAEELEFTDPSKYMLYSHDFEVLTKPSEKWPEVVTAVYNRHIHFCSILPCLYKEGGYVEKKGNRKIYFKWKRDR